MTDHRPFLVTSESVTEGHPDKLCDQVSDAILDAYLTQDPNSRVAVECLATTGLLVIAGEVSSKGQVDATAIARKVVREIGYTESALGFVADEATVLSALHAQSPDIAQGVDRAHEDEQGAGDQGLMYGYACNETTELMPLPIVLAHKLTHRLAILRKDGTLPFLGPDGKAQVTVEYRGETPVRIAAVVVSTQHRESVSIDHVRDEVRKHIIIPVCGKYLDAKTEIHCNPTGRFVIGGPHGDTGLTGRKIIVDTYGGVGRHGGGAFSGKDPSKVDRSAAYAARWIAKHIVAAKLARRCEVQISYAIGVAAPVGVHVETFGTETAPIESIEHGVLATFDLRPHAITIALNLRAPQYQTTAAYGHFGRNEFAWEQTPRLQALVAAVKSAPAHKD